MKHATGLNPLNPYGSVTAPTAGKEGGKQYLALSWPVNPKPGDVVFSVESSVDLQKWLNEGVFVPSGARAERRNKAPIEQSIPVRRLLRLKVKRRDGSFIPHVQARTRPYFSYTPV